MRTQPGWLVGVVAAALVAGSLVLAWRAQTPAPRQKMARSGGVPAELQVVVSEHSKLFHLRECALVHQKDNLRTITAGEAVKQGYVPCVRCLGQYVKNVALRTLGRALARMAA